jgi:glutaredoxin
MLRSVSAINRRLVVAAATAMVLSLAPVPVHAGCSNSVVMYSASWCPYCKQVRDILARNQIRYTILDATAPDVRAAMLERFGDTAVPRTVIGGVVVEGVDEDRIKELCRKPSQAMPLPIDITLPDSPRSGHDAGKWLVAPAIRVRTSALP